MRLQRTLSRVSFPSRDVNLSRRSKPVSAEQERRSRVSAGRRFCRAALAGTEQEESITSRHRSCGIVVSRRSTQSPSLSEQTLSDRTCDGRSRSADEMPSK